MNEHRWNFPEEPRKLEIEFKRVVAFVADTHVGSRFAIFPPNVISNEGNDLSAMRNPGQVQLYEYWTEWEKICDSWGVDTVILLGDIIQGNNPVGRGIGTITPDLDEQKQAAIVLLSKICTNRIVHCLSGTPYHESIDTRIHYDLTNELRSVAKEAHFHGLMANIKLKGTNRILNLAHGVSGASIYRTTLMDREALFEAAAYGLGDLDFLPDIVIRAHWHRFIHIHLPNQHILQVPGWCAWFPYKNTIRLYGKLQPHIGGVILFIDDRDRIMIHHYLFKPPRISDYLREG